MSLLFDYLPLSPMLQKQLKTLPEMSTPYFMLVLWFRLPCFNSNNLPDTQKHKSYKDYSIHSSCHQSTYFKYHSNYITQLIT